MNCTHVREWLRRDFDGAADPSGDVAAHLERCSTCRSEAGRLKALAESARAALPTPDVPRHFSDRVMAEIAPPADAVLAASTRPMWRGWWPVAAALLLIPMAAFWAMRETPPQTITLPEGAHMTMGGVEVTALNDCEVLPEASGRPGRLVSGRVLLTTIAPGRVRTELGEISLNADSTVVAALELEETKMKRVIPAALSVALLAGGASVANAEGQAKADKKRAVRVERLRRAPRHDIATLRHELSEAMHALARAQERLASVQMRFAKWERVPAPPARFDAARSKKMVQAYGVRAAELTSGMKKLQSTLTKLEAKQRQLDQKVADARARPEDSPQSRARIAELARAASALSAEKAVVQNALRQAEEELKRVSPTIPGFGYGGGRGAAAADPRPRANAIKTWVPKPTVEAAENLVVAATIQLQQWRAELSAVEKAAEASKSQAERAKYERSAVAVRKKLASAEAAVAKHRADHEWLTVKSKIKRMPKFLLADRDANEARIAVLQVEIDKLRRANEQLRKPKVVKELSYVNCLGQLKKRPHAEHAAWIQKATSLARTDAERQRMRELRDSLRLLTQMEAHIQTFAKEKKMNALVKTASALVEANERYVDQIEGAITAASPKKRSVR